MTDYEALIKEARTPSNPGDVSAPVWVGGRGDLITRLADAVEELYSAWADADSFAQVNAMNMADWVQMREERDALQDSFQEAEQIHERVVQRLVTERDALRREVATSHRGLASAEEIMRALVAERDEALRALGESRQRFADSETKRAELEAAIAKVRAHAEESAAIGDPTPHAEFEEGLDHGAAIEAEAILRIIDAVPFVVLQDRDAAVWDKGARAALLSEGYAVVEAAAILQTNPYRADQDGAARG